MNELFLLTAFYVATGLLLVAISIPLIQRRIKPNPFYGFRTPTTLKNERVWYEVNAYSGRRLLIAGIIVVITAIVFVFIPNLTLDVYAILVALVLGMSITIGLVQSFRHLREITK